MAVTPRGEGLEKTVSAPLDLTSQTGHRYTVAMMGQADDIRHKTLVIYEMKAYQSLRDTKDKTLVE